MTNPQIPASGDAITADWMERALRAGGASEVPALQDVAVEQIAGGVGLVGEVVRLMAVRAWAGVAPRMMMLPPPPPMSVSNLVASFSRAAYLAYRAVR